MKLDVLYVNWYWLNRDLHAMSLHHHIARINGKPSSTQFVECHCAFCREGRSMNSVGIEFALNVVTESIQSIPCCDVNTN